MPAEDEYRERAEALLRAAAAAVDLRERGRLIDAALHWHTLALAAHEAAQETEPHDVPPGRVRR